MTTDLTPQDDYDKRAKALGLQTLEIFSKGGSSAQIVNRLVTLLPVAFQIVDEARDTIARLRDENEKLRGEVKS